MVFHSKISQVSDPFLKGPKIEPSGNFGINSAMKLWGFAFFAQSVWTWEEIVRTAFKSEASPVQSRTWLWSLLAQGESQS